MKKHAASHGLAVLVCTVTSGLLVIIGKDYYPEFAGRVEEFCRPILSYFNLKYSPDIVAIIIIAAILAVIWGIAFSFLHKDKKE